MTVGNAKPRGSPLPCLNADGKLPVHLAGAVSDGESLSGWASGVWLGDYCSGGSGLTPPRPGFQDENVYLNPGSHPCPQDHHPFFLTVPLSLS